jgi:hypothetical protein
MSIKYGEITIIRDLENESYKTYFARLLGYEPYICKYDNNKIILLLEDGTISEIDYNIKSENIKFGPSLFTLYPSHIDILNPLKMLFYKNSDKVDGIQKLSFYNIFCSYNKGYKNINKDASIYNCIYYMHSYSGKQDVLSILKIKSNETKPRYLVAYDDSILSDNDISYIINCTFRDKFEVSI